MRETLAKIDSGFVVLLVLILVLTIFSKALSDVVSTALIAIAMNVSNFMWGSSQGSRDKDATIAAQATAAQATNTAQVLLPQRNI